MDVRVRLGTEKDLPFVKDLAKECCEASIPPTRKATLDSVKAVIEHAAEKAWPQIFAKAPDCKLLILEKSV